MAKNQNEAGKEKKPEIKGLTTMVKTRDIIGPYPWLKEHERVSRLMGQRLFAAALNNVKRNGIKEAVHLVYLEEAPEHIEDKASFKPGYYTLCGRNRWEIAMLLAIKEMKAEIIKAGPYEKTLEYALSSNLFRKQHRQKDDWIVPTNEPEKDEKKIDNKEGDIDTALNRGIYMKDCLGYEPDSETQREIARLKGALANVKDEKKKTELSERIQALEEGRIDALEISENLNINMEQVHYCYWFYRAFGEDIKEDGIRPKVAGYDYANWEEMAMKKGVKATAEAFGRWFRSQEGKEPDAYKPIKISKKLKNTDDKPENLTTLTFGYLEEVERVVEEHPDCIVKPKLDCIIYEREQITTPKGEIDKRIIPEEKMVETVEGPKVEIPRGNIPDDVIAEKLENATEIATAAEARIEELEDEAKDMQKTLNVELDKKEALEKEVEQLRAKVAEWEKKPQEEKERILKAENHYAHHHFTSKDIAELYGWLDQELRTAMEKFGGLVKFIDVNVEYGRKAD